MRPFRAKTILLATASILLAAPAIADGSDPSQFDLVCRGTRHFLSMNDLPNKVRPTFSSPFTLRIQADIQSRAFCIDRFCDLFTRTEPAQLSYHCDVAKRTTFCGEVAASTAGPFIQRLDISIDRATGAFQRTESGDEGDPAAFHYDMRYSGTCTPAPFTAFSTLQQSILSRAVHGLSP